MEGTITLVQESRFQVTDDGGASHLFVLGPHASAEPAELLVLAARQQRVCIEFRAGDTVIAALAENIYIVDESRA